MEVTRSGSIVQTSVTSIVPLTGIGAPWVEERSSQHNDKMSGRKTRIKKDGRTVAAQRNLERRCLTLSSSPSRAAAQIPREKSSSAHIGLKCIDNALHIARNLLVLTIKSLLGGMFFGASLATPSLVAMVIFVHFSSENIYSNASIFKQPQQNITYCPNYIFLYLAVGNN